MSTEILKIDKIPVYFFEQNNDIPMHNYLEVWSTLKIRKLKLQHSKTIDVSSNMYIFMTLNV